jgi:hypothetical protein
MKINNKYLINRLIIVWLMLTLTFGFYTIPIKNESTSSESMPKTSQFIPRDIRVAIYDEVNTTKPSYADLAILTNDYSSIESVLTGAGFIVSSISTEQIYNHELSTANYDIFVMVDNLPKENITNQVKEFWLGGGGLLTFDSVAAFLCWSGIFVPEAAGDDGYLAYWYYQGQNSANISLRHPITKNYDVNDSISFGISDSWSTFNWTALSGTSTAANFYRLANQPGDLNKATVLGYNPSNGGGKVVHIVTYDQLAADSLLRNAVEWICPRPKGRILYDLSHHPYYGVDSWDAPYTSFASKFLTWRNNLVNRSFTFDKLYPSPLGNLTINNLANYDILVILVPNLNFTANEVNSVMNWVEDGGSLLIFGDNIGLSTELENIKYLLSDTDLAPNLTDNGAPTVSYSEVHPLVEGCSQLYCPSPGLVVYSGTAHPIWGNNADEFIVAGQDYGKGRIILTADGNFLEDNYIDDDDNLQFSINLANWLTASQAEVLLYLDQAGPPDPNDNYYRAPVTIALNDLRIPFYLTYNKYYFNLSMSLDEYPLAIIDNPVSYIADYFDDVLNYMKSGGHLIISSYAYGVSSGNPLWDYLGFEPTGDVFVTPQPIYIWDNSHPIFNAPADYGANSINSTYDYVATDVCNLTVYSNATSIAGLTSSPQLEGGAIILGAGGRSIANAMLITTYMDDTDDSTYPDAQELWENEIAYMMSIIYPPTEPDGFNWLWIIIIAVIIVGALAVIIIIIRKRKK